jgi:N-terminal acetyltransferase B complex catalytic subunit
MAGWGSAQFGYSVYRTVVGYYSGEEDANDMRKPMPRDVHRRSIKPAKARVHPHELEFD